MKTTTPLAAAFLLAATASAQYAIDPDSVPISTRDAWCTQQTAQCPIICSQTSSSVGTPLSNTCDATSLTYACVCSDGISPNISEYSQTLPYYICTAWGDQCSYNCGSDNTCASNCRSQHPCGAQNPTRQNTSTLTTSTSMKMSSTSGVGTSGGAGATTGAAFTGFGDGATSSSAKSGAAAVNVRVWALSVGQTFGTIGVAGALLGGFAVLL